MGMSSIMFASCSGMPGWISFVRGWLGIGGWGLVVGDWWLGIGRRGSGVYWIMSLGVQWSARQSFSICVSLRAENLFLIMRAAVCLSKPFFVRKAILFLIARCANSLLRLYVSI